jgi:tetratricopeptide (TPR) repeat protein
MAKTNRKPTPSTAPGVAPQTPSGWTNNTRLISMLVFGFAFLLYANTLGHGFVLDDQILINQNTFTQQGISGIPGIFSKDSFYGYLHMEGKETMVAGGRYRPLSVALFAIVFQVFGLHAFVFHLLTVLLFAATCVVLYQTLRRLLQGHAESDLVAGIATVLFAAHPVHTEVVANIKGCDEILSLLGSLAALWCLLKAIDTGKSTWNILAGFVFFLACLSKENAVTFVVVAPLALWFFRPVSGGGIVRQAWPMWTAFLLFFVIRGTILHWNFGVEGNEWMNNPFLKSVSGQMVACSPFEKLATILFTLGKYALLLVFPHPLTHDYYPKHIELMGFSSPWVLLSLALYAAAGWYALSGFRKKDPVRFGILFFAITLSIASNLVFPIGTFMGERFLFMPSIGFCLIVATLLTRLEGPARRPAMVALGIIVALFSLKTIIRNPAWASNEALFIADMNVSANSAKLQNDYALTLLAQTDQERDPAKLRDLAEKSAGFYQKALDLYPTYRDAFIGLGRCNFLLKRYDASVAAYTEALKPGEDPGVRNALATTLLDQANSEKDPGKQKILCEQSLAQIKKTLELSPGNTNAIPIRAGCYFLLKNFDASIADYRLAYSQDNKNVQVRTLLALALRERGKIQGEQRGDIAGAIPYLTESWQVSPTESETARLIGVAQALQGKYDESLTWFRRAVEINPNAADLLSDLSSAYYLAGDAAKGAEYRQKAIDLNPVYANKPIPTRNR